MQFVLGRLRMPPADPDTNFEDAQVLASATGFHILSIEDTQQWHTHIWQDGPQYTLPTINFTYFQRRNELPRVSLSVHPDSLWGHLIGRLSTILWNGLFGFNCSAVICSRQDAQEPLFAIHASAQLRQNSVLQHGVSTTCLKTSPQIGHSSSSSIKKRSCRDEMSPSL